MIQQVSTVNTDEYSIYARLPAWGYIHVTVSQSEGEYARDADEDGVNDVHVNTMEGVWSLLQSWLRPTVAFHSGFSRSRSASFRPCTTPGSTVSGQACSRALFWTRSHFSAHCSPCF